MSQHDFLIDNGSGIAVRADLNSALQALATLSSGATAPTVTYSYQPWYDTTAGVLKIRNGANNAWVTVGPLADVTKFEIYTNNTKQVEVDANGNAIFSATGAIRMPRGTTGQRPTPAQGQIRFNTTTNSFEGYDGTAWGSIGGAGNVRVDTFTGNGSQTNFTLTADPGSVNNTIVTIGGVFQQKATYTIAGTTLTLSPAPGSGLPIEVMYNVALSIGTPSDGTVTTAKMNSGAATNGQALVANGSGGASYATITGRLTAGTAAVQNPYALATTTTQAHGLGVQPALFRVELECLTANNNYSVGDKVQLGMQSITNTGVNGIIILADATNTTLITHASDTLTLLNKTTRVNTGALTPAHWRLTVTPYAIS